MKAGDLRQRITIQTAAVTRDAFGAETITWHDGPTLWAQIIEKGGREPLLADRPVMIVGYEITVRYTAITAALTHLHRLRWEQKILQIETVTPERTTGCVRLRSLEIAP